MGVKLGRIEWDNAVYACTITHCNVSIQDILGRFLDRFESRHSRQPISTQKDKRADPQCSYAFRWHMTFPREF